MTAPVDAPEGFAWRATPLGDVLISMALASRAPHCFTTRAANFRAGPDGAPSRDWQTAAEMFDFRHGVWRVHQVHGTGIVALDGAARGADGRGGVAGEADALVSDTPGAAVAVQTADCVPVLLASGDGRLVSAVHAGWRGAAAGIVGSAVAEFVRRGASAGTVVAALGPSIGSCCYQVGEEVRRAFVEARGSESAALFVPDPPGRYRLDMWEACRAQLVEAGVAASNVHVSGLCTRCRADRFYSYRAEGERTGRLAGIVGIRG
ncbi:MAG: peptidoglycan editing factor PgeF, partial [Vicinamibacteraceae bacterium]|nr:peptidoglycan editing factor PgeF [Vicinamibacteraceae bacterium]